MSAPPGRPRFADTSEHHRRALAAIGCKTPLDCSIDIQPEATVPDCCPTITHIGACLVRLCQGVVCPDIIKIDIAVDPDLALPVRLALGLCLSLDILITDAIERAFDQNGGTIFVSLVAAEGGRAARLVIEDNGRGIGYTRAQTDSAAKVEHLVNQIGGKLWQHGGPGTGRRFSIKIPRTAPEGLASTEPVSPPDESVRSGSVSTAADDIQMAASK